jgi:peptide/nickel transport system substrate-binding protein
VRNPSWDPATDELRPAYADRIEISLDGTHEENLAQLEQDRVDVVLDSEPTPDQLRRYRERPELEGRLFRNAGDAIFFVSMNLAVPPFDDLQVRKAVNLAIDKAELRRLLGTAPVPAWGWLSGNGAGHVIPDSLEANLLLDYDPYATPGDEGDIEAARAEMTQSRHDGDGDGLCDGPPCEDVLLLTRSEGPFPAMAAEIKNNLEAIGIGVTVEALEPEALFEQLGDPHEKVPLAVGSGWQKGIPSGGDFVVPLFHSSSIEEGFNASLVGAAPEQLREWGYEVTSVPSIDAQIAACLPLVGNSTQAECWAEADQFLMENVVPWVPYVAAEIVRAVSSRVERFAYSQFTALPALDQIALVPNQP